MCFTVRTQWLLVFLLSAVKGWENPTRKPYSPWDVVSVCNTASKFLYCDSQRPEMSLEDDPFKTKSKSLYIETTRVQVELNEGKKQNTKASKTIQIMFPWLQGISCGTQTFFYSPSASTTMIRDSLGIHWILPIMRISASGHWGWWTDSHILSLCTGIQYQTLKN